MIRVAEMRQSAMLVPAALVPAAALLAWHQPWLPVQMLVSGALAVLLDMGLRGGRRPCAHSLANAWIICLVLSPAAPWWAATCGAVFAVLVQRCYGGAQLCPFNPAMAGAGMVLALWPWAAAIHGPAAGALLAGAGMALILLRLRSWQAPLGMLATLAAAALLGHPPGGGSLALGAFFVATDPASSPASGRGRLAFGVLCGLLVVAGGAAGLAFALLVANMAAPWLDEAMPCRA